MSRSNRTFVRTIISMYMHEDFECPGSEPRTSPPQEVRNGSDVTVLLVNPEVKLRNGAL